jgi:beta-galactosidase
MRRIVIWLFVGLLVLGGTDQYVLAGSDAITPPGASMVALTQPFRFQGGDDPVERAAEATFDDQAWSQITLPHTWAGPDGKPTYSNAWYRTTFMVNPAAGETVYLHFAGVATVAEVYVNGKSVGTHRGAYTAFVCDITAAVRPGAANVLAVRVNNNGVDTVDCLPSGTAKQLYRVYGGMYRMAYVYTVPPVHIYPELASSGVFVTTKSVAGNTAELSIRTAIRNSSYQAQSLRVRHGVNAPKQNTPATQDSEAITIAAGEIKSVVTSITVTNPALWAPGQPNLYELTTSLQPVAQGMTTLRAATPPLVTTFGIRTITFQKGQFILNGQPFYVRGVNKHQETEHKLTAVAPEDLLADWEQLSEIGANTVRLAHYPHAPLEYDQADRRGMAVWAENGHSNKNTPTATGELITREMVRQNYNHPAIIFWSCGNEAESVASSRYAEVIREEDTTRVVTYASNGQNPTGVDIIARNVYPGWYGGHLNGFTNQYTSETGAGGSLATHCAAEKARWTVDKYEPEEYQQLVAEQRLQTVFGNEPDKHPMLLWWTFREFGDSKYKGRNSKGILTYAGYRKSIFYLFESFLRPQVPVVRIASPTWMVRGSAGESGVKVYSNQPSLTLTLNGTAVGTLENGSYVQPVVKVVKVTGTKTVPEPVPTPPLTVANVFYWNKLKFQAGNNLVQVSDGAGHTDRVTIYYAGSDAVTAENPQGLLVQNLESSNPENPAYFHTEPVHAQWPVYYQCDGQAENTFDALPVLVEGAQRIVTKRCSLALQVTDLSFTVSAPATVYVMVSGSAEVMTKQLIDTGFTEVGGSLRWRDNVAALVPAKLFAKAYPSGQSIKLKGSSEDYAVLVKPK